MKKSPGTSSLRGRGAASNPQNRFETLETVLDADIPEDERPGPKTQFFKETAKTIITKNDSPDVGFEYSINPYRGCEHGCIYCYARPTHEYLGLSAGLDFETKIFVKENAPELLTKELSSKHWSPEVISLCGVTDPYQPGERHFKLTRRCLEVLSAFNNPAGIITKNHLITRDLDLLKSMAERRLILVYLSITTLDRDLWKVLEPRTAPPESRMETIRTLTQAGIPVGVNVAPVIPALTDSEVPQILRQAAEAGAKWAGHVVLRLPHAVSPLFESWLERHFPDRKGKVISRLKSLRGGKLYESDFATRMTGEGVFAQQIADIFKVSCRQFGLNQMKFGLSREKFQVPEGEKKGQMGLF